MWEILYCRITDLSRNADFQQISENLKIAINLSIFGVESPFLVSELQIVYIFRKYKKNYYFLLFGNIRPAGLYDPPRIEC